MIETCFVFTYTPDGSDRVGVYITDGRTNFFGGSISVEELPRFIEELKNHRTREERKILFEKFGLVEDTSC